MEGFEKNCRKTSIAIVQNMARQIQSSGW